MSATATNRTEQQIRVSGLIAVLFFFLPQHKQEVTSVRPPTQHIDEQFVQLVGQQRLREAVEVIRDRLEDVPLEAGIGRVLAVIFWP